MKGIDVPGHEQTVVSDRFVVTYTAVVLVLMVLIVAGYGLIAATV